MKQLWGKFLQIVRLREPPCDHVWRPCVAVLHTWGDENKPARICAICREWEPLTQEQFYAQFGESFYARAAKRQPAMEKGQREGQ